MKFNSQGCIAGEYRIKMFAARIYAGNLLLQI